MCGLILRSVGIVCGGLGNPAAILIVLWTVFDLVVWVYFRVYYCTLVRKLRSSTVEVCQITVYLWSSTWGIFNLYLLNIPGDWTVTVYYGIPCLCTLVWKWEILQCGAGVPDFLRMQSSGNLVQPFERKGFWCYACARFSLRHCGQLYIWWYKVGDLHCFEGEVLGLVGAE